MTFAFTIGPKKLNFLQKNEKLLGCLNCFSAGVFLALALLHIMPENELTFTEYFEEGEEDEHAGHNHRLLAEDSHAGHAHSGQFPLPNAMVFIGLIILLVNDRVLFGHGHHQSKSDVVATSSI